MPPGQPLLAINPNLYTLSNYVYCGREGTVGTTINRGTPTKALTTVIDIGVSDQAPPDHRLQNNTRNKYDTLHEYLRATAQTLVNTIEYSILADLNDATGYGLNLVELENVLTRLFALGSGHTPASGFTGGSQKSAYINIAHAAVVAPHAAYHFLHEPQTFLRRIADFDTHVFQPWAASGGANMVVGPRNDPVGVKMEFAPTAIAGSPVRTLISVDCRNVFECLSSSRRPSPSRNPTFANPTQSLLLRQMQRLI